MRFISHKKWIITTAALCVAITALALEAPKIRRDAPKDTSISAATKNRAAASNKKADSNQLLVTVLEVSKQTQQAIVTGYGEATAKWTTELTAEVSGRVDYVSDQLLAGSSFNKGDVLAKINSVDYESELATALSDLATAEVAYLEQERETKQANERWKLSGLAGTPSALTLQTPQLAKALAAHESAKASLAKAKKNVERTKIIAPYNGRVSSRIINPGGFVSAGSVIAKVFATDVVEINVSLNEQQFALIGSEDQAIGKLVNLVDTADDQSQWSAKVVRFQYHINSTERTRNLVLSVNSIQAEKYLMPGTFVKASIPGKSINDLLKIPGSALSRDGYIWYVEDNSLQRFKADIAYRKDDYIVVNGLAEKNSLHIVRYPQSAFIPGQMVTTELFENNKQVTGDSLKFKGARS